MESGRFFTANEVQRRQNVIVLGQTAKVALFPVEDPIGKQVRLGLYLYTVIGVMAKRPSLSDGSAFAKTTRAPSRSATAPLSGEGSTYTTSPAPKARAAATA